jgi:hypothetical protein
MSKKEKVVFSLCFFVEKRKGMLLPDGVIISDDFDEAFC